MGNILQAFLLHTKVLVVVSQKNTRMSIWVASWTSCFFPETPFLLESTSDRQTVVVQTWYLTDTSQSEMLACHFKEKSWQYLSLITTFEPPSTNENFENLVSAMVSLTAFQCLKISGGIKMWVTNIVYWSVSTLRTSAWFTEPIFSTWPMFDNTESLKAQVH